MYRHSSMFQIACRQPCRGKADDAVRIAIDEVVDNDCLSGTSVTTQEDILS